MTFQFGDFYYSGSPKDYWTIIGIFLGPIVSVIISISVFKASAIKEKKKDDERLNILKIQIANYLHLLEDNITIQFNNLLKILPQIKEKKVIDYDLKVSYEINYYAIKLSEINQIDLYKIFIEKEASNLDKLSRIQEDIDLAKNMVEFLIREYKLFNERDIQCQSLYNNSISEIGKFYNNLSGSLDKLNIGSKERDFLISFNLIYNKFVSIKDKDFKDIYVSNDSLIKELRNSYNTNSPNFPFLDNLILDCEYSFRDLEQYKKDFRKYLIFTIRAFLKIKLSMIDNSKGLIDK